jgi:tetratricopeptide (TPR) repeat protein
MKAGMIQRLALVAAVGAAGFLAACASGNRAMVEDTVEPTRDDYVTELGGDPTVTRRQSAETAESRSTRPGRDARVSGDASSRRGDSARATDDQQTEMQRLAAYYAREAERHYTEQRFQEAITYARDALLMDGDNQQAALVLSNAEQALGQGRSQADLMARSRSQQESALRAEALHEISRGLDTADRMIRAQQYTEALGELEKVLDVIRWTNYMVETESFEREARLMMQEAQTLREQARLDDYVRIREQERRIKEVEIQQELNRYREEVRNLYTQAREYFDRREYRDTVIVLNKILREDPYNEQVQRLRRIAADLDTGKRDREAWEDFNRNWRESMQSIWASNAPPVNDVTLPDFEHWQRINRRADILESERRTPLSREDIAVRNALENVTVELQYDGTPLDDVIAILRGQGRINILRSRGVPGEDPVDMEIGRVNLRQALDLITNSLNLAWRVENGAVIISEEGDVEGRNVLRRVFDVSDLLITMTTFRGKEPRLVVEDGSAASGPWRAEEEDIEDDPVTIDDLQDLIEMAIDPDSWHREGHGINYRQRDLIVLNTADNVDRVANLLRDLRRAQGLTVSVEARFITIRDDFLEDIGVDFRGIGGSPQIPPPGIPPVPAALDDIQFGSNFRPAGPGGTGNDAGFFFQDMPPSGNVRIDQRVRIENLFDQALAGRRGNIGLTNRGGASFQLAFIDNPEINAVIRAVRKRERATLLTAPRVTVHNTQRGHVSVLNEIAYISDFEPNTAAGVAVAQPIVAVIRDGIVLDVRPTISADRRYVTLELRPTLATLLRPIPTFQTSLGVGPPVAIQTPQLTLQRIRTTVTVPDGGSFVIGGLREMVETTMDSGIPIVSDLPLIGWLFTRKGKSVVRQDIIIIVTARIIDLEEEEEYQYGAGPSRPR